MAIHQWDMLIIFVSCLANERPKGANQGIHAQKYGKMAGTASGATWISWAGERKIDPKRAALTQSAFYFDFTSMQFHDSHGNA